MNKSKQFRQRRQAARARRHADKRRELAHEYTPNGIEMPTLTVTPVPTPAYHRYDAPNVDMSVIARPHLNRRAPGGTRKAKTE